MRRLLLLLLALGLWQIAYAQIHCGLEPADCLEGDCELCHLSDVTPLQSGGVTVSLVLPSAFATLVAPRCRPLGPPLRRRLGRAPPC